MHLAAQYLATAAISFLPKKEDDSHTNLGFSAEEGSLYSRNLNDRGDKLALNYTRFTLEWNTTEGAETFRLDGSTHAEVLTWLKKKTTTLNAKGSYAYDLHYELPYAISEDFTFRIVDVPRLQEVLHYRILAQFVLEAIVQEFELDSDIRIWPHHFDTGAFGVLDENAGLTVGLGLAIPDSVCDDYYFYVSGYHGHDSVDTLNFKPLSIGKWSSEGFVGGILPAKNVDEKKGITFFTEALNTYKTS